MKAWATNCRCSSRCSLPSLQATVSDFSTGKKKVELLKDVIVQLVNDSRNDANRPFHRLGWRLYEQNDGDKDQG